MSSNNFIIVHNYTDVIRAMEVPSACMVNLINAPYSIYYLGIYYIEEMAKYLDHKQIAHKQHISFILDCDEDISCVIKSMKMKFQTILFRGDTNKFKKLEALAKSNGKLLISTTAKNSTTTSN